MKKIMPLILLFAVILTTALSGVCYAGEHIAKEATDYTAAANKAFYKLLDFSDRKEFENATKGLIEAPKSLVIYNADGSVAWNLDAIGNVDGEAPARANPSLWRNTQLNAYAGLFKVCEGIYQVRGYDIANVTFIRTDNGWVVFDVLMCVEDMREALALMEKHFGKLDIKAVLYSHPHVDHFGGVDAIMTKEQAADAKLPIEKQLASGKIPVIAPEGFFQHAISENIYAGTAMARRAQYQYGVLLPRGAEANGALALGIGLAQSVGTISLIAPTYEITNDRKKLTIDGLEIVFQLTPGTEAPAEMNAYFPRYKALWMAENCNGTMHNLYTLRGAEVRSASDWSRYMLEAEQLFGDKTKVVFQSHNWPHWNEEVRPYLINTAAVYKFIHDQTLHYINLGYTANEISNMIALPKQLEKIWYTRQYYGTLSHNVRAVYQKYIGWYDANPVNLNPMSPVQTAKKLVEYLGGAETVLKKARADFEKGEYQWVAQITKELVYADPSNKKARNLCADALEQLGYQAESGTWRCCYLMGALELRLGNQALGGRGSVGLDDTMREMTPQMIFDYIAILTDALSAQNDDVTINFIITDTKEKWHVCRKDGVLLYYENETGKSADAVITCTKAELFAALTGAQGKPQKITGDATALTRLIKYIPEPNASFNIIEP